VRKLAAVCAAALTLIPISSPADAGARQQAQVLMSERPQSRQVQENWGFSDAVITGDTIYLSGIVADKGPNDKDLAPAYERVYRQVEGILKRAGASWDDVVDMSSFHTDVEGQIESMVAVHKRYVKAPYPAWTAIGVARILGNGITEIKITARRPTGAGGSK